MGETTFNAKPNSLQRHKRLYRQSEIMQSFKTAAFLRAFRTISEMRAMAHQRDREQERIDDLLIEWFQVQASGLAEQVAQLQLTASLKSIETLRRHLNFGLRYFDIAPLVVDIESRIIDEIDEPKFFYMGIDDARLYESSDPLFGASVEEAFPSAIDDIDEAGKCLACGRYAASIYHLMGALQVALECTAKSLRCMIDVNSDSWETIIKRMEEAIKVRQSKLRIRKKWKEVEPFYSELISDLRSVKNAWRNPTMHFHRGIRTEEQARRIFDAVKIFMQHVASQVKEGRARI